eukprot:Blabericola_migrator_1__1158@NODE_129_length_13297_cov_112_007559_g114_i0_p3_GENE_NODE_129_length_13297_cov_112_007559_g114_i0NODE_129_length_13297_cov_112_007559_g114_i0_p3_ORF_typecomplete_len544_score65_17COesterase/PF00135_28/2_9e83Abhydrolase_3/PF07859_13/1_3e13Chlorophyllase2/PF12740_7/0_00021Esterase/PF00756_20/0_0045Say1_Mug180/PF10340_9/0_024Chlorophyllase/PF07224_11/0_41_NODE_129_length_13297_cov_112_007559_g114_i039635594
MRVDQPEVLHATPDVLIRPTSEGLIIGTITEDATCYLWAGVPFASISDVSRRFKIASAPLPHMDSVLDCTKFGPAPVSVPISFTNIHDLAESDTECLSLNIYVPVNIADIAAEAPQSVGKLPVLVWIHGGGFASGAGGAYGGESMAAEGSVIVVTVNYRLGVFGFLNLNAAFSGTYDETGYPLDNDFDPNVGLYDQLAALQWIHRNIAFFHGDSHNITIAGSAAGAACCAMHLTHQLSQPYFQKVILHSGSLTMCDDYEASRDKAVRFLNILKKKTGKNALVELKEFLLTSDAEVLQDMLTEAVEQSREFYPLGPWFGGSSAMPQSREIALSAMPGDKSVLIGYNRDEANLWLVLANAGGLPLTKASVDHVMQRITDEQKRKEVSALYPRDMSGITNFATDVVFANTIRLLSDCLAQRLNSTTSAGVWRYRIDEPLAVLPQLGAVHGNELTRLWKMPGAQPMLGPNLPTTPTTDPLSRRLRWTWALFASTGNPGWNKYTGDQANVLVFENAPFNAEGRCERLVTDHESIRKVQVWRGLELLVW